MTTIKLWKRKEEQFCQAKATTARTWRFPVMNNNQTGPLSDCSEEEKDRKHSTAQRQRHSTVTEQPKNCPCQLTWVSTLLTVDNSSLILFLPLLSKNSSLERFYLLFIFRERGMEGEKHWCERETWMGCLLSMPWPGTGLQLKTCTLTGIRTSDILLCRMMPNQLSHTGQGQVKILTIFSHEIASAS